MAVALPQDPLMAIFAAAQRLLTASSRGPAHIHVRVSTRRISLSRHCEHPNAKCDAAEAHLQCKGIAHDLETLQGHRQRRTSRARIRCRAQMKTKMRVAAVYRSHACHSRSKVIGKGSKGCEVEAHSRGRAGWTPASKGVRMAALGEFSRMMGIKSRLFKLLVSARASNCRLSVHPSPHDANLPAPK